MPANVSPLMRLCFPHLVEPQAPQEGSTGDPKFSLVGLIPKKSAGTPAFKAMYAAAVAAAKKKFGDNVFAKSGGKWPEWLRSPFRDGDTDTDDEGTLKKEKYPEYAGCYYVTFRSTDRPRAKDRAGNIIPVECYKEELYAGCIVRVSYGCFGYSVSGNKGVSFALNNIQKMADHEPLGSQVPVEADFQDDADGADEQFAAFGIESVVVVDDVTRVEDDEVVF